MNEKLRKALKISIFKTVLLNARYFGSEGVVHPRIIVSKNTIIKSYGEVVFNEANSRVWLGFGEIGFVDNKRERTIWDISGRVEFVGNATFGPAVKLICMEGGYIRFGKDFTCTCGSKIISNKSIVFGDNDLISWGCTIMDTDFHKIRDADLSSIRNMDADIHIGDHVWICCESLILKGVLIPNNSVISAKSKVTRKLTDINGLYQSNELIKSNIAWDV